MMTNRPIKRSLCRAVWLVCALCLTMDTTSRAADEHDQDAARWWALPPMPEGVLAAAGSAVDGRAVITGGINQLGVATQAVQVFDLDAQKWTTPVRLRTGRCFHAQASLPGGRVVVAGGRAGAFTALQPLRTTELIDLQAGRVSSLPPLPRAARAPTAHTLADGRVVVIGGLSASVLNGGDEPRWGKHVDLRRRRSAHASVLLPDGRVLVAGGEGEASIEVVDLRRGVSVMLAARLPFPIDDLRLVVAANGYVWVLGGQNGKTGQTTEQTWLLDLSGPNRAVLGRGPKLGVPGGVADAAVVTLGHYAVMVGGETDRGGRDAELASSRLLDLRTLDVRPLPELPWPCDDTVALGFGRSVIVFGGYQQRKGLLPGVKAAVPIANMAVWRLDLHD